MDAHSLRCRFVYATNACSLLSIKEQQGNDSSQSCGPGVSVTLTPGNGAQSCIQFGSLAGENVFSG